MLDLDNSSSSYMTCDNTIDFVKWHVITGHIGKESITRLTKEGLLVSLTNVSVPMCESYHACKAYTKPFGKAPRAFYPLELVHLDICGTMNVKEYYDTINPYFSCAFPLETTRLTFLFMKF